MISMNVEVARFFKGAIETISKIREDGFLYFNKDGLKITELNDSRIQFVELNMPDSVFDVYSIDKPVKVAIDFKELLVFLSRWRKTYIDIDLSEDSDGFIRRIKFIYPETKREFELFELLTIDREYESPEPPVLVYPSHILINKKEYKDALQDFNKFCDKLVYETGDTLTLRGENESGKMNIKIDIQKAIDLEKDDRSLISSEWINKIIKTIPEKEIELELGNDMPLGIISKNMDASLRIITAPKIIMEEEKERFIVE